MQQSRPRHFLHPVLGRLAALTTFGNWALKNFHSYVQRNERLPTLQSLDLTFKKVPKPDKPRVLFLVTLFLFLHPIVEQQGLLQELDSAFLGLSVIVLAFVAHKIPQTNIFLSRWLGTGISNEYLCGWNRCCWQYVDASHTKCMLFTCFFVSGYSSKPVYIVITNDARHWRIDGT